MVFSPSSPGLINPLSLGVFTGGRDEIEVLDEVVGCVGGDVSSFVFWLASASSNLLSFSYIHASPAFEKSFFNNFASLIPRDVEVNKETLIKNVLPLYISRGNEKSFKLLFRMLFNDEVDVILPKNNVLICLYD